MSIITVNRSSRTTTCVLAILVAVLIAAPAFAQTASTQTLLTTQKPAELHQNDGVGYELGLKFYSDTPGQIKAVRFWKDSSERGTHVGRIWNSSGALLASVTFASETASGWQQQNLATPLSVSANAVYVVTVNTGKNYYVASTRGLSTAVNNLHLHSVVGANGVYGAIGKYPTQSYYYSNYFRDVVFQPSSSGTTAVSVAVNPQTASVATGATYQFSATVTGTTNTGVSWSVVSGGGTISTTGLYTAPTSATTATIKATSVADTTKSASATVTVTAPATIGVTMSPTTASVATGATYQFKASVTGTTNTAVTWSMVSGGGTISTTGLYTAPTSATTATIKATSVADTTKSATATVTVTAPAAIGVTVSPTSASVNTGATYQFNASVTGTTNTSVTWSVVSGGGTISSTGLYTAPSTATTASIKATSVADSTKSASATVTVTAPAALSVAISPGSATIDTGASYQFTATVTSSTTTATTLAAATNTSVTWSVVSGGGTISSAGLYTAPAAATTATVKATSVADPTKSATATVTVDAPVVVTISPSNAAISTGATMQFTAAVTGSTAGVSWSVVSGSGTISSTGLYTAPASATTTTVRAVSNSDALATATATVTVSAPASGNAGCGATGTYPNLLPLDQSACGNVTADGSAVSYEPSYNDSSATVISACGTTIHAPGSYKLNGNLACGGSSTAISIQPQSTTGIYVNLKGYTVTGLISVNDYSGHLAGGVSVFNGVVNCNVQGGCVSTENSNGSTPYVAPVTYHHLTVSNSNDNCTGISVDGNFSSAMAGAGKTGAPYTDVIHHVTVNVNGGTGTSGGSTSARCGGGGIAGSYRTVHIFNTEIKNGDSNTNHYTEGWDCYKTYNCDIHNNYFHPNKQTTGDTPGRMILLDGDAYGNGSDNTFATGMTQNANVYSNYFYLNGDRAIRHRSAQNVWAHDNLMDGVMDSPIGSTMGVHYGDLTGTGPNGTGVYNLGASVYERNVLIFTGPINGSGPKAFGDGYNAVGVAFKNNRIMCSGTGCSGITGAGHAVTVMTQGLGSPRYADVSACNITSDSPLPTPLHIDGSAETQTSYLRTSGAGTCSASSGAQCVAVSSCQ